jgi:hypothetical protein
MQTSSDDRRRWLVSFGLSLAVLAGLALLLSARLPGYRDPPFDFRAMNSDQLFVLHQLTRRQGGAIKVGFAEGYDPPEIGLYGNHIFQFFGSDAFGRDDSTKLFFNYWYANLSLPEVYRYLRHIEQLGRLPTKLILVQITSPNLDNGHFIINFGNELPPDLLLRGNEGDGLMDKATRIGETAWNITENWLHQTLNYNTFILSPLQETSGKRVVDPGSCRNEEIDKPRSFFRRLPNSVQQIFAVYKGQYFCQRRMWSGAFRNDGSTDPAYADTRLMRDEDSLRDSDRGLVAGDEYKIARQMGEIDAIGRRHDIRVTFIVPPGYESDRSDSVVNQIFDRALALVPEIAVVDDRSKHSDPSFFTDYHHPSPRYFRLLVQELRRRGIVQGERWTW